MPSDGSLNSLSDNTTTDKNAGSKHVTLVTVESKTVDQAIGGSVPPGTNSFNVITVNFPPALLKRYSPPPSSPSPSEEKKDSGKDRGISVQKDNALVDKTLEKKDAGATVSGSQEIVSEPVSIYLWKRVIHPSTQFIHSWYHPFIIPSIHSWYHPFIHTSIHSSFIHPFSHCTIIHVHVRSSFPKSSCIVSCI